MTITDIKEKFGTLHIFTQTAWLPPTPRVKVEEAIDLTEARSACTCETCGAAGRLHLRPQGGQRIFQFEEVVQRPGAQRGRRGSCLPAGPPVSEKNLASPRHRD